jgi:hypothetical protein
VLTISDERAFGYAKAPVVSSVKTMPASGICDDAVYTVTPGVTPGFGTSLSVKKGNSYFVVHVYGFPEQTKAIWPWKRRLPSRCVRSCECALESFT